MHPGVFRERAKLEKVQKPKTQTTIARKIWAQTLENEAWSRKPMLVFRLISGI